MTILNDRTRLIDLLFFVIYSIFGSRQVDGYNRDGKIEKFYKAKNDEYHYFYMVEYLREHLKMR